MHRTSARLKNCNSSYHFHLDNKRVNQHCGRMEENRSGSCFGLAPIETDRTGHISSSFVHNSYGRCGNEWIAILIRPFKNETNFFSPWADQNITEKKEEDKTYSMAKLSVLHSPIRAIADHLEFKWPQNIHTYLVLIGLHAKIVTNPQIIIHYSHRHISKQTNLSALRADMHHACLHLYPHKAQAGSSVGKMC